MLWYKNWLETKARVVFAIAWFAMYLLLLFGGIPSTDPPSEGQSPVAPASAVRLISTVSSFPFVFIFTFMAGAGISTPLIIGGRNQSAGKSTSYTLSLPVSRRRLLLVRAALGLLETTVLSTVLVSLVWAAFLRGNTTIIAMAGHLLTLLAFGVGLYFLSTFFATFLEDPYHIMAASLFPVLLLFLSSCGWLHPSINILVLIGFRFWASPVQSRLVCFPGPRWRFRWHWGRFFFLHL